MDGSLVTIAEQNRDDMNNFSQETPSRKVRTQQCGKRKRNPDEFELRIMKALDERNQPNRHLSFFKGIIPSLQNFNEEETLHFQMGVLQLIANIKHRKSSNFSSQPLLVYNQPFHTSSHVGGNNQFLVYASTKNPHHLNITTVQPLAVDTGMVPRTAGQESAMHNPSLSHIQRQTNMDSILNDRPVHLPPQTMILQYKLRHHHSQLQITQTAALISRVCSSKKYVLNYYRLCHANTLKYINK